MTASAHKIKIQDTSHGPINNIYIYTNLLRTYHGFTLRLTL
jgi:hypothetical protein